MILPLFLRYDLEVSIDVVALLFAIEDNDLAPCLQFFVRPVFGNIIEVAIQMQSCLAVRGVQRIGVEGLRMPNQTHA